MRGFSNIKRIAPLSLYGLSMVWSPIFGTSESSVFATLAEFPNEIFYSRILNLAAFGLVMLILAFTGERIKTRLDHGALLPMAVGVGTLGLLLGSLCGLGVLPLEYLCVGAVARGASCAIITVLWINLLIHVQQNYIGAAVAAALAVYAAYGLAIVLIAPFSPVAATILLVACPALTYVGCLITEKEITAIQPAEQDSRQAPKKTRWMFYGANFLFGITIGAILYYFATYDAPEMVLTFLLTSVVLTVFFAAFSNKGDLRFAYRAFMMCFAVIVPTIIALGLTQGDAPILIASATLAVIILYTITIFVDTQARFRVPFWKVPGMCQVSAVLGMIISSIIFRNVLPISSNPGLSLLLMTAACVVFVASLFISSTPSEKRPWGFTSLIPAESPEIRRLRNCGELARANKLTTRELEILQLLVAGSAKNEIAETLFISPATAKTHVRNIYSKLNVHSKNELAALVDQMS